MRAHAGPWLLWLVSLAGCFDLSLPPQPGVGPPGLLSGRLVWQRPGRLQLEPARGASVFVLGTNLAATSTDDGRFLIDGLTSDEGSLFIRFDGDQDGVPERQRAFRLRELGAGRGRQLSIGEIVLGSSAAVTGRVLRGDVTDPVGHFGTPVFVPGFPLVAVTGAEGAFVLEGLPEGSAQLAAVRTDYQAHLTGPLTLRGGEELSLAKVTLARELAPVSGVLRGRVVDLEGAPLAGVSVSLSGRTALTDGAGTWRFSGLPADRYDAVFSAPGRLPAALYNVLVAGPEEIITPDVVLAPGQPTGSTPSLVADVSMERDAGTSPDGGGGRDGGLDAGSDGGSDAGIGVSIGTPVPFTVLVPGPGVGVAAQVMPPQPSATYSWSASPPGLVMIGNPSAPNTGLVGIAAGTFRLDLSVTVAGQTYVAPFVTGTVVLAPDSGVDAGVDAGTDAGLPATQLTVTDAGASALAMWVECEGPFVPPLVGAVTRGGSPVPAVLTYNGVTRRLVAVFDEPQPVASLSLEAPSLQLMDGGLRRLAPVTQSTPSLAFGPPLSLHDGGLADFNAGAAYTPDGVVVTGRYFDGAGCNGCFFVSGPRGQDAMTPTGSLDAGVGVPWRRAQAAGFTVQSWYSNTQVFSRAFMGTGWSPAATPPGPLFTEGPMLRALGVNGSQQLQLWTFNSAWTANETFGPFASGVTLLRSSAVAQPGGALFAQVIDDSGKVEVWTKPPAGNWQPVGATLPNITGAVGGRIASTTVGLVMFVQTGSGAAVYRLAGSSWTQIAFTGKPLDLVGRGARAFLVSAGASDQLEVWVVDPVSGALTSTVLAPSAPVRSAELAAGDFGDLAVAWSTEDAGVFELLVSTLE